jgi:prepilin-type N-terminal cleavage/methylation domain-containing protein
MHPRSRQAGVSLTELLMVVVLIGMLVALASPRIRRSFLRNEVINSRNAVANLYTTARLSAVQTTRRVVLKKVGDVVHIAAWPRLDGTGGPTARDTIGAVVDLFDRHEVELSGSPDSILIDPKGFGGSTLLWVVRRAEFRDTVQVNNLGVVIR